MNSIDPRRNPCQDFYEYACGGWIKSHEIPKDYPYLDQWILSKMKVEEFLKDFLINKELQSRYRNVSYTWIM